MCRKNVTVMERPIYVE